jgi:hypothetical protein
LRNAAGSAPSKAPVERGSLVQRVGQFPDVRSADAQVSWVGWRAVQLRERGRVRAGSRAGDRRDSGRLVDHLEERGLVDGGERVAAGEA